MESTPTPEVRLMLAMLGIAFSYALIRFSSETVGFEQWVAKRLRVPFFRETDASYWRVRRRAQAALGVVFLILTVLAAISALVGMA